MTTTIDEILEQIYTLASGNENLKNHKARTMEEWFTHRDIDLVAAKAAIEALLSQREKAARIDELEHLKRSVLLDTDLPYEPDIQDWADKRIRALSGEPETRGKH